MPPERYSTQFASEFLLSFPNASPNYSLNARRDRPGLQRAEPASVHSRVQNARQASQRKASSFQGVEFNWPPPAARPDTLRPRSNYSTFTFNPGSFLSPALSSVAFNTPRAFLLPQRSALAIVLEKQSSVDSRRFVTPGVNGRRVPSEITRAAASLCAANFL
ncbi:hypothetical protein KM043_004529 [Ampulex compressa]|nr:hypothetical protein KM043_004529 [Ampulex compressa]